MIRHTLLCLLRIVLSVAVVYALPYSHAEWGDSYPDDGQQAFGMLVIFAVIGAGFGLLYFIFGSTLQFLLRAKEPRFTVGADTVLFLLLSGVLVYAGVTARYSENGDPSLEPDRVHGATTSS